MLFYISGILILASAFAAALIYPKTKSYRRKLESEKGDFMKFIKH